MIGQDAAVSPGTIESARCGVLDLHRESHLPAHKFPWRPAWANRHDGRSSNHNERLESEERRSKGEYALLYVFHNRFESVGICEPVPAAPAA
jgi:hypothetical protein